MAVSQRWVKGGIVSVSSAGLGPANRTSRRIFHISWNVRIPEFHNFEQMWGETKCEEAFLNVADKDGGKKIGTGRVQSEMSKRPRCRRKESKNCKCCPVSLLIEPDSFWPTQRASDVTATWAKAVHWLPKQWKAGKVGQDLPPAHLEWLVLISPARAVEGSNEPHRRQGAGSGVPRSCWG